MYDIMYRTTRKTDLSNYLSKLFIAMLYGAANNYLIQI